MENINTISGYIFFMVLAILIGFLLYLKKRRRIRLIQMENDSNIKIKSQLNPQPIPHPITKVDFDEFFSENEKVLSSLRDYAKYKIVNSLGWSSDIYNRIKLSQASDKITIVFSGETLQGIKEGKYYLPIDKKYGLPSTNVRDKQGKIIEHGKKQIVKPSLSSKVFNIVTVAAHIISDLDTQFQIAEINKKIDGIYGFLEADRTGEVIGIYHSLQSYFRENNDNEAERLKLKLKLDELEGRFFSTARERLLKIENPAKSGFTKTTFRRARTNIEGTNRDIGNVFKDLSYMEKCNYLNWMLQVDSGNVDEQIALKKRLQNYYQKISSDLDTKCRYSTEIYKQLENGQLLNRKIKYLEASYKSLETLKDNANTIEVIPINE